VLSAPVSILHGAILAEARSVPGRQSTSRDIRNVCQLAWARRRHMGLRWRLCAGTKCQIL